MKVTEMTLDKMYLLRQFITSYQLSLNTMRTQKAHDGRSADIETGISMEWIWLHRLTSDQQAFLEPYGYTDYINQLAGFAHENGYDLTGN